ncbi:MAG: hypothetical protein J6R16_00315 [Alistipes sp.]|nr:hypothetical protein [Alistipes sp.]
MRKLFNIFAVVALALGFVSCQEKATDEPQTDVQPIVPVLVADKTEMLANGADAVTFTATVNGTANDEVQIICLNDNSILNQKIFTTTTPGSYRFVAVYNNESSNVVEITAKEVEKIITLEADKSEIIADNTETVTFTVKVDGEEVIDGYEIINLNYNSALEGNTFTSDVAGEFKFQAKYEGRWPSNEVTITVNNVPVPEHKELKITASPNRIKADGVEEALFTVMYGDENVTAEAEIYNTATQEVIESKKFASTTVGSYNFRARYDGQTTGVSATVEVYDPALAGKYEIGTIYEVNGVKGVIYAIKTDNKGYTWCYLFSLDEEDLQWSTKYEWCNCISDKGAWNTYDPFNYYGMDINNYPAFKWCMDHGDDWFLPSSKELEWMWEAITEGARDFDAPAVAKWNKIITDNGGEPFVETYYWSSNETSDDLIEVIAFMDDSVVCLDPAKDNVYTARAAYRFQVE